MTFTKSMSVADFLVACAIIGVGAALLLPGLQRMAEADRRSACADNLRRLGVVFKMYANEDPDHKYPKFGWDIPVAPIGPDDPNDRYDPSNQIFYFGPYVPPIFPEYLKDPSVFFCPSDETITVQDLNSTDIAKCIELSPARAVDTGEHSADTCGDNAGCMQLAGASYIYFGWLLDETRETDLSTDLSIFEPVVITLSDSFPERFNFDNIIAPLQPVSLFVEWFLITALTEELGTNFDLNAAAEAADSDYTFGDTGGHDTATSGNGSGNKIYRLREGVERFIVSDLANPSAFTQAQSEIFVMYDSIYTSYRHKPVEDEYNGSYFDGHEFNHRPVGSNVLFLDGHVEFQRMPPDGSALPSTQSPINRKMFNFTDIFLSAFEDRWCQQ